MKRSIQFLLIAIVALGLPACSTSRSGLDPARMNHAARLSALDQALADADKALATGLTTAEASNAYRTAVEKAVALWLADTSAVTTRNPYSANYQLQASWPKGLLFDELIPASAIKGKELKRRIVREGVGAPLVAHWNYTPERKKDEPFMTEGGYVKSATATIDFRSGGNGRRIASLVLHDSRQTETVRLGGSTRPLGADFSAMGEYVLSKKENRMPALGALVKSDKYMDKLGLISLERPDPNRIPLILVHGLMSRPATWQNVFNELGADPVLQKRYQILFFRYPSGVPVLFSAAKLREHLGLLNSILKRQGSTVTDQMVMIGHSMGGLVTKSQVQSSGDRLWVNVMGSAPDRLNLSKEEREALAKYLEFEPNRYISRVIFVATPHRGSEMAISPIGKIGRRIISLPGRTLGNAFSILQGQAPKNQTLRELASKGVPTSVDNLSPKSLYVKTSINLPLRPGLHVHSIIGNKKEKPLNDPKCTDGLVPYWSSHLDGVESEYVVPFGHSAHEHPDAVKEMRRILLLHLKGLPSR